jgi:chaperonin cofactor prefoldin
MTDLDSLDKRLDTMERDMRVLNEQLDEIKRNVRKRPHDASGRRL